MNSDDPTLVEPLDHELLRASFHPSDEGRALLEEQLNSTIVRHRVLALRGLVRLNLMTLEQWRRVLSDADTDVRRDALQSAIHNAATTDRS